MSRVRRAISAIVTDHRSAFAVVAGIVGAVVGLAAVIFNWLIAVWMRATTGAADYSVTGGAPHGWPAWTHILIIAVPVVSALMYGPMIWRWAPTAKGHGIPEVMLAVRRRGGKIPGRVAVVKLVSSALTIGGGGSAGREGPIVQVGASLGSTIASWVRLPTTRVVVLASCGAAGGIAATFHAPLAGAIFALEVILVRFTAEAFGYVVISSVMASIVARALQGSAPLVDLNYSVDLASLTDIGWAALVGLIAGLCGLAFSKLLYAMEDWLDWGWERLTAVIAFPQWSRAALMSVVLGIGLFFFPAMYGSGYPIQLEALHGALPIATLLALAVGRMIFTSFTIGMGGSGGVFAPTLFIGAMVGSAIGHLIDPLTDSSIAVFGVIGMGAAFAGAARAPMTAVLIIVEMTDQYSLILPMMLAVVIATGCSRFLTRSTIYTEKLRRRGDILDDPVSHTLLGVNPAGALMQPAPATLSPSDTIMRAVSRMREAHAQALPVVDADGVVSGVVSALDIASWREEGVEHDTALEALPLRHVYVVDTDLPSTVMRVLTSSGVEGIPVLHDDGQGAPAHMVGWISGRDLVDRMYRDQRRALDARIESSFGSRWRERHPRRRS